MHNCTGEAAGRDAAGADGLEADDPGVAGPAALAQPESKTTPARAATFASRDFGARTGPSPGHRALPGIRKVISL